MKKIRVLLLLSLFTLQCIAQEKSENQTNAGVDKRISEVFGSQLNSLVLNDPQRLKDLNAILFERHEIVETAQTADEKYPKLSQARLFNNYNPNLTRDAKFDKATFNLLKYDLNFFSRATQVYRIDNTNFLLVIHPQNLRK